MKSTSKRDEESPLILNDLEHDSLPVKRSKSIFDEKAVNELEAAAGGKVVALVIDSPTGFVFQMVLFFMLVLVIGLTPFFTQLLLRDPVTGLKSATFIPQTPYLIDFIITVILSNTLSLILFGTKGLKDCWDIKSITRLSPISLLYGTAQSLEVVAMLYLNSAFRTILNQLKLPFSAILQCLVLGEKYTVLQWCLVAATTTSVCGFILANLKNRGDTNAITGIAGPGLAYGCTAVACSFFAAWMTDIKTKKMGGHLVTQVAQLRLTTAMVVAAYTIGWAAQHGELWKLPFYGWNIKVFGLSCFLVLKDILTIYVLKKLSNIWLGLATCAGLGVSYIADILFLDERFESVCFTFIVAVSILTVAWPASKNK